MTDGIRTRPQRATKLFVEFSAGDHIEERAEWLEGADGMVIDREAGATVLEHATTAHGDCIVRDADPDAMYGLRDRPGARWVDGGGLDAALRMRDAWPDLDWVPYVEVYRPETRFDFQPAAPGEGFSVYMPDTATIQGFRIAGAEREPVEAWLSRAVAEGFRCVWLHGRDAAAADQGADIELLARARRHFAGGRIWLSGGIAEPRHLKTLAREGGAKAAVIPAMVARQWGCATLAEALVLDPPAGRPIAPGSRSSPCGPVCNMA